jgi:uncharacterized protein (TIGR01319 family)
MRADRPDIVLLVGGTDGGEADVLCHNASRLARARLRVPVVVAGNADVRDEVAATLREAGTPVVATENVLPRIGSLNPGPARAAVREVFLRHVIGGKHLSRGPRFASLVRGATPDIVLTGVELLAEQVDGDLLVVDVGGATTDVYSVLEPDERSHEVAGTAWHGRSVEGDLGLRWSAPGVVAAAAAERLLGPAEELNEPAQLRAADPGFVPLTDIDQDVDTRLAHLAATIALRRHARRSRDLGGVRLFVGSGGALRHARPDMAAQSLAAMLTDHAGGWALPRAANVTVDFDYVLAPAGLLAEDHPEAAAALLRNHLWDN